MGTAALYPWEVSTGPHHTFRLGHVARQFACFHDRGLTVMSDWFAALYVGAILLYGWLAATQGQDR
jgi:hypothetical protein